MYQVNNYEDWVTISPSLDKFLTWYTKNTKKFNRIRFKLTGSANNEALVFLGIEIPEMIGEQVVT